MSKRKIRNITAAFWLGLFFMSSYEPVFIWLLIISLIVLSPDSEKKEGGSGRKDLLNQIGSDAKKHGVRMPRKQVLRSLLIQVYRKYNQSIVDYAHLKSDYDEVLEEMWISLASHVDADHWETTISKVCSGWPKSKETHSTSIEDRLKKVSELTSQWDEAKREVRGGASV